MQENDILAKLRDRAFKLLAIRPRSEQELRDRLSSISIKEETNITSLVEKIIEQLRQAELIDDRKFAEWLIESRKGKNPKGSYGIKHELSSFGIDDQTIESLLNSNYSPDIEQQQIEKIIEKKWKTIHETDRRKIKKKLVDFLLRRGFSFTRIYPVVDEFLRKSYNTD